MRKYLLLILIILACFTASCTKKPEVEIVSIIEDHDTPMIEESNKRASYEVWKFKFPLPEKYRDVRVTSSQGLRGKIEIPNSGGLTTSGSWHQGLDFAVPEGTEVYASKEGYVSCVYPGYKNGSKWRGHPLYGALIIISHPDNTITLYAHLSETKVLEGTYVNAGQLIALSGGNPKYKTAGTSTGSHLHFGIYLSMDDIFE